MTVWNSRSLCELQYITIDDAIQKIIKLGQGSLLKKLTFRVPSGIHLTYHHLLATHWKKRLYIDICLAFWLRSAPKLLNILTDLLISKQGAFSLIHYLDNFFTIGPPPSAICKQNLSIITRTCEELGVPLALGKVESLATSLPFLGMILDSSMMEARLPPDKFTHHTARTYWLARKNYKKANALTGWLSPPYSQSCLLW